MLTATRPAAPLVVLVLLLPLLLVGCSLDRTASKRAQTLADEVFPGQLTVVGQRSEPGTVGLPVTEVQLRVGDDPDAVVRLSQGADAAALRTAVDLARSQAETYRGVRDALRAGDLAVGAVDLGSAGSSGLQTIYLPVLPATDDAAEMVDRLDTALAASAGLRSTVVLADPAAVADLPDQDESLPTLYRLSATEQVRRFEAAGRFRGTVMPSDDGEPWTLWASLTPVQSRTDREALDTDLRAAADAWLAAQRPGLVTGQVWWGYARLERGTLDRVRVYLPACPAGTIGCTPAGAEVLVAATADLAADRVADLTALPSPRQGGGGWSPPLERARLR